MNVAQVFQVFKNHKVIVLGLVSIMVLVGVGIRFLPPVVKTKYQEIQDQKFVSQLTIKQPSEMPAGMPVKSFYDYDPTVYNAMFTVESVNAANKTMNLRFIYPFKFKDNVITSKVDCALADTRNFLTKSDDLVMADQTVYEEKRIVPGQSVMQAKCDDKYCRVITKYCELWVK
jgi:hypothetical protein